MIPDFARSLCCCLRRRECLADTQIQGTSVLGQIDTEADILAAANLSALLPLFSAALPSVADHGHATAATHKSFIGLWSGLLLSVLCSAWRSFFRLTGCRRLPWCVWPRLKRRGISKILILRTRPCHWSGTRILHLVYSVPFVFWRDYPKGKSRGRFRHGRAAAILPYLSFGQSSMAKSDDGPAAGGFCRACVAWAGRTAKENSRREPGAAYTPRLFGGVALFFITLIFPINSTATGSPLVGPRRNGVALVVSPRASSGPAVDRNSIVGGGICTARAQSGRA